MIRYALTILAVLVIGASAADAGHGWEGKRRISHQRPNDLFYNYYVGPYPSGTAAQMYVSPQPVPAQMGHTYTTYQPFMPHEMLYKHRRSYYTNHADGGWTRTNVRYSTVGTCWQSLNYRLYDDTFCGWLHRGNFNTRP